jgi:hypothetical protein
LLAIIGPIDPDVGSDSSSSASIRKPPPTTPPRPRIPLRRGLTVAGVDTHPGPFEAFYAVLARLSWAPCASSRTPRASRILAVEIGARVAELVARRLLPTPLEAVEQDD